jgi:hypothetical protein
MVKPRYQAILIVRVVLPVRLGRKGRAIAVNRIRSTGFERDRDGHQVFLERKDYVRIWFYPNGINTSLPTDVQLYTCVWKDSKRVEMVVRDMLSV